MIKRRYRKEVNRDKRNKKTIRNIIRHDPVRLSSIEIYESMERMGTFRKLTELSRYEDPSVMATDEWQRWAAKKLTAPAPGRPPVYLENDESIRRAFGVFLWRRALLGLKLEHRAYNSFTWLPVTTKDATCNLFWLPNPEQIINEMLEGKIVYTVKGQWRMENTDYQVI